LSFEIYCKCNCTTQENSDPADSFKTTSRGRFENVSKRISFAKQALEGAGNNREGQYQFFLDRIREVAPEMLQD